MDVEILIERAMMLFSFLYNYASDSDKYQHLCIAINDNYPSCIQFRVVIIFGGN